MNNENKKWKGGWQRLEIISGWGKLNKKSVTPIFYKIAKRYSTNDSKRNKVISLYKFTKLTNKRTKE
jgi:hypothetical protein